MSDPYAQEPLRSIPHSELLRLRADSEALARVQAESDGRLQVLNEKCEEARREWTRAENAEEALARVTKERDEARADCAKLMQPGGYEYLSGERDKAERLAMQRLHAAEAIAAERDSLRATLSKLRALVEPIRELEGKATKGPWHVDGHVVQEVYCSCCARNKDDADLIVALRSLAPALLEAVKESEHEEESDAG